MIMNVIPARIFELQIDLQSWNESNCDEASRTRSCETGTGDSPVCSRNYLYVMAMSDGGRFENKVKHTFIEDLVKCGQRHDEYDDSHLKLV